MLLQTLQKSFSFYGATCEDLCIYDVTCIFLTPMQHYRIKGILDFLKLINPVATKVFQ
jgi:hypothetical protein